MNKIIHWGILLITVNILLLFPAQAQLEKATNLEELEDGYYSFNAENLQGFFKKSGNKIIIRDVAYYEEAGCYQGTVEQNHLTNLEFSKPLPPGETVDSINFDVNYQKIASLEDSQVQELIQIKELEECVALLNSN